MIIYRSLISPVIKLFSCLSTLPNPIDNVSKTRNIFFVGEAGMVL